MKSAAILLLLGGTGVAVSAQAPRAPAGAPGRSNEKPSLCVVGKASNQREAVVPVPQHEPSPQEMDAIADALLNCSPAEMEAIRARAAAPAGMIARGGDVRAAQSIPTGNG